MKESVAVAKETDAKKGVSPTKSDNSIHRVRNEPERQLGSLRGVIDNIRRDGGKPSVESIATELSGVHAGERAPVLLALQQTHGNRYVQRVVAGIQAKLKIGQPHDKYEQEADGVADAVIRMPPARIAHEPGEKEELLRVKLISGMTPGVTSDIQSYLSRTRGSGSPLSAEPRAFMEERFGIDFSAVRIHTDSEAAEISSLLGAEAFTVGKDVYLGGGRYNPASTGGKRLLAHELTHVVQQNREMSTSPIGHVQQSTPVPFLQCTRVIVREGCNGTSAELDQAVAAAMVGIGHIADDEAKECLTEELDRATIICEGDTLCGETHYIGRRIRVYNWGSGCPSLPALILHETAHKCKRDDEEFAEACENEAFGGHGATPPAAGEAGGTCEL